MLIIDMPMPKGCWLCPCCDGEYGVCAAVGRDLDDPNERPDWCPIKGEINEVELMNLEQEREFAVKNIVSEKDGERKEGAE